MMGIKLQRSPESIVFTLLAIAFLILFQVSELKALQISDGQIGEGRAVPPGFSHDSEYVVFSKYGGPYYVYNIETGTTETVNDGSIGYTETNSHNYVFYTSTIDSPIHFPTVESADGRYYTLNGQAILIDRLTGTRTQMNDPTTVGFDRWIPSMSTDGRYVVYTGYLDGSWESTIHFRMTVILD